MSRPRRACRVSGLHVLAIQDTTNFHATGTGTGVVGHATIVVEAEAGSREAAVVGLNAVIASCHEFAP
ncbi:MAG: hypothetical protein OXE76_10770 [Alphaproteobacteria bacterium]|nr:hypothetical protein [Alphaproteobacteria bacterium]